jgi:thiol-disulfide isomerase/thioredoxin
MGQRTAFAAVLLKPLAVGLMLAGVAAIGAGAFYYRFQAAPSAAVSAVSPLPAAPSSKQGEGFVLHEEPQAVPELSFVDAEGNDLSLAAFRGRTVLLNVWATWCVPCREEMPALERLQTKLGGPDFQVVPLSIDRGGIPKVSAFYGELGLNALGIYVDASGKAGYALGTVGIPTTLLIDPAGLEIGRLVGPAEWDSPEYIQIIQRQLKAVRDAD